MGALTSFGTAMRIGRFWQFIWNWAGKFGDGCGCNVYPPDRAPDRSVLLPLCCHGPCLVINLISFHASPYGGRAWKRHGHRPLANFGKCVCAKNKNIDAREQLNASFACGTWRCRNRNTIQTAKSIFPTCYVMWREFNTGRSFVYFYFVNFDEKMFVKMGGNW